MNGSSSTELASTLSPRRSNINEKRVSFDIENDSDEGLNYPHTDYTDNKAALASSKNPVVAADILKTLFFILVWYTFSTFLTL
jgi:solute carrier family 35, member C2